LTEGPRVTLSAGEAMLAALEALAAWHL
jgi:hypothetical protein